MEGLKLNVGAFVSQQIHHQLEVVGLADVARHHGEVVSVQQQLAQELQKRERERERCSDRIELLRWDTWCPMRVKPSETASW